MIHLAAGSTCVYSSPLLVYTLSYPLHSIGGQSAAAGQETNKYIFVLKQVSGERTLQPLIFLISCCFFNYRGTVFSGELLSEVTTFEKFRVTRPLLTAVILWRPTGPALRRATFRQSDRNSSSSAPKYLRHHQVAQLFAERGIAASFKERRSR